MILVADSGSTKTDWMVAGRPTTSASTVGLNPFFVSEDDVRLAATSAAQGLGTDQVEKVIFYGAGCSSADKCATVASGLRAAFPMATIEVEHDVLGAARAACGKQSGIAGILGTGSNACVYDGTSITSQIRSLGYIAGDEGSGAALGKALVKAYAYLEMPSDLVRAFESETEADMKTILQRLYHAPQPNRYLASFAPFCSAHRTHPFIHRLLAQCFDEYALRMIRNLHTQTPVSLVGSVAVAFEPEVRAALNRHGFELGRVIKKPIEALVQWHSPS